MRNLGCRRNHHLASPRASSDNEVAVFQLPATSGSEHPVSCYAGAYLPNTPLGTFSAGYDPHTITAYTSPNNGKAYVLS